MTCKRVTNCIIRILIYIQYSLKTPTNMPQAAAVFLWNYNNLVQFFINFEFSHVVFINNFFNRCRYFQLFALLVCSTSCSRLRCVFRELGLTRYTGVAPSKVLQFIKEYRKNLMLSNLAERLYFSNCALFWLFFYIFIFLFAQKIIILQF